jgi:tRNA (guanine-N7-)-methyltransferase
MTRPLLFAAGGSEAEWGLPSAGAPADLLRLLGPDGGALPAAEWELEIGFGKGRHLLRRAKEHPERRFLGVEIANEYFRILIDRARKRGLANVAAIRGEALYALSAVLPRGFARALHVYHPDPWPKARHQKRRLFDPETVDLVLGAVAPGGELYFATDHLDYGELVIELLGGHPGVSIRRLDGGWPGGPRTNYEAKYVEEGRPILRVVGTIGERPAALHPAGAPGIVAAWRPPEPPSDRAEHEEEEAR